MLIPQFTVSRLFWLVTSAVAVALLASFAFRGFALAKSLLAMLYLLAACFVAFALLYSSGLAIGRLRGQQERPASPFARDTMPPRHVAPENE